MAVFGQSHSIWKSRVADHISHGNTIVRRVPIEVGHSVSLMIAPQNLCRNVCVENVFPKATMCLFHLYIQSILP